MYKVYRGVNNSDVSRHDLGTQIKVIPYKDLSVIYLDTVANKCVYE
jgi:hypothetical protein